MVSTTIHDHEPAVTPSRSLWARFVEANKKYCRSRLEPRFYPVTHMTAVECWFDRRVKPHPDGTLLEFGSGRDMPLTRLLGDRFAARFATDLDALPASEIPTGVTYRQCGESRLPFDNEQFDAVVIRSVLEHVAEPRLTFDELARVAKPDASVFLNLPNKWDYVSVIGRVSGPWKSSILKSIVGTGWEDFPVHYNCNTRRALVRLAEDAGFEVVEWRPLPSQPSYLAFFVPLYILGAIYQFAISLLALDVLQPSFLVRLKRRSRTSDPSAEGCA